MSYRQRGNTVTMTCNATGCNRSLSTDIPPGGTMLDATRSLWRRADGWTSTSTEHLCPRHSD